MTIKPVTVTFERGEFLRSLWRDDRSGMRHGINLDSYPDDWKLLSVWMNGDDVTLVIQRLEQKDETP